MCGNALTLYANETVSEVRYSICVVQSMVAVGLVQREIQDIAMVVGSWDLNLAHSPSKYCSLARRNTNISIFSALCAPLVICMDGSLRA